MKRDYSRKFLGSVGCIDGERVDAGQFTLRLSPSDARALTRALYVAAEEAVKR